jgi:hypothetical protein
VTRTSLYQQMSMEAEAGNVQLSGAIDSVLVFAVQYFASTP